MQYYNMCYKYHGLVSMPMPVFGVVRVPGAAADC